jgi:hypothetical protein
MTIKVIIVMTMVFYKSTFMKLLVKKISKDLSDYYLKYIYLNFLILYITYILFHT